MTFLTHTDQRPIFWPPCTLSEISSQHRHCYNAKTSLTANEKEKDEAAI